MFWYVLVSVYYTLLHGAIPRSDENLLKSLEEHNQNLTSMYLNLSSTLQAVKRSLDEKLEQQALTFEIEIKKLNEKLDALLDQVNENLQNAESQDTNRNDPDVWDCSDIMRNGQTTSGVYRIYVDHQNQRYYARAYCDMMATEGGWTIFQKRADGSVDFYRDWKDYANGFGSPNEFWLGNKFLHLLTLKRRYQLRIDLMDFENEYRYADYSIFSISSSADKYRLTVGGYSGTAGDSLLYHSGCQFSTKDKDNDLSPSACSTDFRGAWWYRDCQYSNLNGLYLSGKYNSSYYLSRNGLEGVRWSSWYDGWYSLKMTEMKILPYS